MLEGIIESGNNNLVVADVSTISAQSEHCAQRLRSAGIEMLGVPVMGGPASG